MPPIKNLQSKVESCKRTPSDPAADELDRGLAAHEAGVPRDDEDQRVEFARLLRAPSRPPTLT